MLLWYNIVVFLSGAENTCTWLYMEVAYVVINEFE